MGARTGEAYLEALRTNGPEVWLGRDRVVDVTSHPAIGPAAHTLAGLYDLRFDPQYSQDMLFQPSDHDAPVGVEHRQSADLDANFADTYTDTSSRPGGRLARVPHRAGAHHDQ